MIDSQIAKLDRAITIKKARISWPHSRSRARNTETKKCARTQVKPSHAHVRGRYKFKKERERETTTIAPTRRRFRVSYFRGPTKRRSSGQWRPPGLYHSNVTLAPRLTARIRTHACVYLTLPPSPLSLSLPLPSSSPLCTPYYYCYLS